MEFAFIGGTLFRKAVVPAGRTFISPISVARLFLITDEAKRRRGGTKTRRRQQEKDQAGHVRRGGGLRRRQLPETQWYVFNQYCASNHFHPKPRTSIVYNNFRCFSVFSVPKDARSTGCSATAAATAGSTCTASVWIARSSPRRTTTYAAIASRI